MSVLFAHLGVFRIKLRHDKTDTIPRSEGSASESEEESSCSSSWDKNELRFCKRHGSLSSTTRETLCYIISSCVLDDGDKLWQKIVWCVCITLGMCRVFLVRHCRFYIHRVIYYESNHINFHRLFACENQRTWVPNESCVWFYAGRKNTCIHTCNARQACMHAYIYIDININVWCVSSAQNNLRNSFWFFA